MKLPIHRPQPGFTLIEMMTVVFIIIILAGLGVGGYGLVTQRSNKAKANVDIALLSNGIESYQKDMGEYPGLDADTDLEGDVSEELYDALFYQGYLSQSSGSPGVDTVEIYVVELDPRNSKQTLVTKTTSNIPPPDLKILDPWKRPYLYRKGKFAQNPDFDLWSKGKDGETEYEDPDSSSGPSADDVRNF